MKSGHLAHPSRCSGTCRHSSSVLCPHLSLPLVNSWQLDMRGGWTPWGMQNMWGGGGVALYEPSSEIPYFSVALWLAAAVQILCQTLEMLLASWKMTLWSQCYHVHSSPEAPMRGFFIPGAFLGSLCVADAVPAFLTVFFFPDPLVHTGLWLTQMLQSALCLNVSLGCGWAHVHVCMCMQEGEMVFKIHQLWTSYCSM